MRPASGSGNHDRDRYDATLIRHGRFGELLASYYDDLRVVVARRVGRDDVDDVLHDVVLHLGGELRRGATYSVPFRVVAFNRARWSAQDHHAARAGGDVPVDGVDEDLPAPDEVDDVVGRMSVEQHIAQLPPGDRRVAELRWLRGLEPEEVATRLGRTRNAVDQALFRARRELGKAMRHER